MISGQLIYQTGMLQYLTITKKMVKGQYQKSDPQLN